MYAGTGVRETRGNRRRDRRPDPPVPDLFASLCTRRRLYWMVRPTTDDRRSSAAEGNARELLPWRIWDRLTLPHSRRSRSVPYTCDRGGERLALPHCTPPVVRNLPGTDRLAC